MKYIDGSMPTVELTRRNLTALLSKLDGNPPGSFCTIIDPDYRVAVKAVEDAEHYSERAPGDMHPLTRVD